MLKMSILFLSLLVMFSSCSNTFLKSQQLKRESSKVHFIVDVFSQLPEGNSVFRDDSGKDFLGLKEPDYSKVDKTIEKIAGPIKEILKKIPLVENPLDFGIASTHKEIGRSHRFFQLLLKNIFDPNGEKKFNLNERTFSEKDRTSLLYSDESDDDTFDLGFLSDGYYKRKHGLNLNPKTCPQMKSTFLRSSKGDMEEFKSLINSKYEDLINYFADKYQDTEFGGKSEDYSWIYLGNKQAFKNSIEDLYNLIETINFDYKYGMVSENSLDKVVSLNKIKIAIFEHFFPELTVYVGNRFTNFLTKLLERREKLINNPYENRNLKNFLVIGSYETNKELLINYYINLLKITENIDTYDKSLFLVFRGDKKKIKSVDFLINNKKIGSLTISEFFNIGNDKKINSNSFEQYCYGQVLDAPEVK
jgi:hypothetical protein